MGKQRLSDRLSKNVDSIEEGIQEATTEVTTSTPKNVEKQEQYAHLPIDLITVAENIRRKYNEESLNELAASMKKYGQITPCTVVERGSGYVIIVGHRRYYAAQKAGLSVLKCIVRGEFQEEIDRIFVQAIENDQREDLDPEERENYLAELEALGQTPAQICERLGKSASWYAIVRKAKEVRDKHGEAFRKAGIPLTTRDAYSIRDVSTEGVAKVIETVRSAGSTPQAKGAAIKAAAAAATKEDTRGRKPKTPVPRASVNPQMEKVDGGVGAPVNQDETERPVVSEPRHEEIPADSPSVPAVNKSEEKVLVYTTIKYALVIDDSAKSIAITDGCIGAGEEVQKHILSTIQAFYRNKGYAVK